VDGNGKVDTLAVQSDMSMEKIRDIWRRVRDIPDGLPIEMIKKNAATYHWGIPVRYQPALECTLCFPSTRLNAFLFDGLSDFLGMQPSQVLDVKMRPLDQCQIVRNNNRLIIRCGQDLTLLEERIIKDHALSFLLNGPKIQDPVASSWWLPYDKEEITRYGDRLNTDIPP
jgi:hypothetical protein